ncbi:endonuclease/exonuclease/phosphatase family protein [Alcanivorax sp. P2S70]|uniref:endonuclease/exonuclease/phosphatase family protein n=1 Tax=Alcanivorax sp. P2S70 TaxID=1397527 RepID=UPI0004ACCCAF|nr:endonuclease/exonuclease/phosphatase family protein [Alcanivorax sp. P2S70]
MKKLIAALLLVGHLPAAAACGDLDAPRGVPEADQGQWALASLNLWRLRDATRESDLDDALPVALVEDRLDSISEFIAEDLKAPHALVLQEVENKALLDSLAQRLRAKGLRYFSVLIEGNDPSGMDVGLLYREPIQVDSVAALYANEQFQRGPLYSRPPLHIALAKPLALDLVAVHMRSARNLGSARVYQKRRQQSSRLAHWVRENRERRVIVAGDFNSSWGKGRFSDSYNRFRSAKLVNVWDRLPENERFSYRYRCRPQALDHIWISVSLEDSVERVAVSRGNAGRYQKLYGSKGVSPVSDHDVLVVYFSEGR